MEPCRLLSIFYADFDNETGPRIRHQYPENVFTHEHHKIFSHNIIARPEFCGRVTVMDSMIYPWTLVTFPDEIMNEKYDRHFFRYNVSFIFAKGRCQTVPYEAVLRKFGLWLRMAEERSGYLRDAQSQDEMLGILKIVYEGLTQRGQVRLEMRRRDYTMRLLLRPHTPWTPTTNWREIKDHDVPVRHCLGLAEAVDELCTPIPGEQPEATFDLALMQVMPHINGVKHVKKISIDSEVDINLVKDALQWALFTEQITLTDVFRYSNIYKRTSSTAEIIRRPGFQMACWERIAKTIGRPDGVVTGENGPNAPGGANDDRGVAPYGWGFGATTPKAGLRGGSAVGTPVTPSISEVRTAGTSAERMTTGMTTSGTSAEKMTTGMATSGTSAERVTTGTTTSGTGRASATAAGTGAGAREAATADAASVTTNTTATMQASAVASAPASAPAPGTQAGATAAAAAAATATTPVTRTASRTSTTTPGVSSSSASSAFGFTSGGPSSGGSSSSGASGNRGVSQIGGAGTGAAGSGTGPSERGNILPAPHPAVLTMLYELFTGERTVKDVLREAVGGPCFTEEIDHRSMCSFGVQIGILRRLHHYPVCIKSDDASKDIHRNPKAESTPNNIHISSNGLAKHSGEHSVERPRARSKDQAQEVSSERFSFGPERTAEVLLAGKHDLPSVQRLLDGTRTEDALCCHLGCSPKQLSSFVTSDGSELVRPLF